jgi:hypothetical protein
MTNTSPLHQSGLCGALQLRGWRRGLKRRRHLNITLRRAEYLIKSPYSSLIWPGSKIVLQYGVSRLFLASRQSPHFASRRQSTIPTRFKRPKWRRSYWIDQPSVMPTKRSNWSGRVSKMWTTPSAEAPTCRERGRIGIGVVRGATDTGDAVQGRADRAVWA